MGGEWDMRQTWDDETSIYETSIESKALRRKINNEQLHYFKAKELNVLCPIPKPNEQYRIITEKQFNSFALIINLLQTRNIDELYLAIYRINEPTVATLTEFIDNGRIKYAAFVLSSFFNATKKPEVWTKVLSEYCQNNPEKTKHTYAHIHAKVMAAKSKDDYFVFEGSGNMSDNARIEQYVYENNKQVFDFHKDWIIGLINK